MDGEPATTGRWVSEGQLIQLIELDEKPAKIYEFELEVVYEDEYLAVVNKPSGIAVSGNKFQTVQNALPFNLQYSKEKDALKKFLPVHRLDAPTSGLLLIAKTKFARVHLGNQFEKKSIRKRYQAVAIGKMEASGKIDFPIENKSSKTEFRLVEQVPSLKNEWLSLVDLFPLTGRTHQLRIHLSKSGFPILGDKLYGKSGLILKGKGLFLCAVELTFAHPISNEKLTIKIKTPAKFHSFIKGEKRRWQKYN